MQVRRTVVALRRETHHYRNWYQFARSHLMNGCPLYCLCIFSFYSHCRYSQSCSVYLSLGHFDDLKRGYIEFKYYADVIHCDLTPTG